MITNRRRTHEKSRNFRRWFVFSFVCRSLFVRSSVVPRVCASVSEDGYGMIWNSTVEVEKREQGPSRGLIDEKYRLKKLIDELSVSE